MLPFTEYQGVNVYSDTVISHLPPSEILKHLNNEELAKASRGPVKEDAVTLDSVASDFGVRYALNLLLKNQSLKSDRKVTDYIRTHQSPDAAAEDGASVHSLFGSDFRLVYLNPNVSLDFGSSNDPSYYQLFVALVRSVNGVLLAPGEQSLASLATCCSNLDACLFSNASSSYLHDMLQFYRRAGAVSLAEDYVFTQQKVSGVTLLDEAKLSTPGAARSDIGFSLSPSGFLIPYHLGILSYLHESNVINCTVPLAGASSGSLSMCSSVVTNGFINSMNIIESASARMRAQQKTVEGRTARPASGKSKKQPNSLDDIVKSTLYEILTDGCVEFINERIGKLTVAYSVIRNLRFKSRLCSEFKDTSDLVDCLRASSYIPIISGEFVVYKGEPCYDGQLSLNKSVGCADTDSLRTIRVNPYEFTTRQISRQMLANEYITPHLARSDRFLEHYLRLKCLTRRLCLRRIVLEELNVPSEFQKELAYAIRLFGQIPSGSAGTRGKGSCPTYKATREYTNLSALWESQNILDLFVSVALEERSRDVSKYTLQRYQVDPGVDVMDKFGSLRALQRPIHSSPVTLLTYLYLQLSPSTAEEFKSEIPPGLYPAIVSCGGPTATGEVGSGSSARLASLESLKSLLTHLVPPLTLVYSYCNCGTLISNTVPKKKLFNISLYSAEPFELRYFYDLGRTDAFRWMVQEYIKFENYLYLRMLQLSHPQGQPDARPGSPHPAPHETDAARPPLLDEAQTRLIHANLKMISTHGLAKQPSSDSVHYKFFQSLNNAVRSAILCNFVDPHFSHMFSHSHFWSYNKHFRF